MHDAVRAGSGNETVGRGAAKPILPQNGVNMNVDYAHEISAALRLANRAMHPGFTLTEVGFVKAKSH
jgi:hypothetical protein